MRERARRPLAHDEMCLHPRSMQHLQQSHAKDRPRGARDADYESRRFRLFHAGLILYECVRLRKEAMILVAHKCSII